MVLILQVTGDLVVLNFRYIERFNFSWRSRDRTATIATKIL